MAYADAPRLFLITPPRFEAGVFPRLLADVLAAADIAAVLIAGAAEAASEAATGTIAAELVGIVQDAGAAALVLDDTRVAGRLRADGVHVGSGLGDLRLAVGSLGGKRIVGAGNLPSRHSAMEAAEIGADYVFFGRPHGDTHDSPHRKAVELAEWWSALMQIPAVQMAGRSIESVAEAAATGAAFVGVHDAIWSHPGGPVEAMRLAATALRLAGREAA